MPLKGCWSPSSATRYWVRGWVHRVEVAARIPRRGEDPEAHAPGCDPLAVACHVASDHGYRPGTGDPDRLHLRVHRADPVWWALPDFPWAFVYRPRRASM